jgi:hypothetical protein
LEGVMLCDDAELAKAEIAEKMFEVGTGQKDVWPALVRGASRAALTTSRRSTTGGTCPP